MAQADWVAPGRDTPRAPRPIDRQRAITGSELFTLGLACVLLSMFLSVRYLPMVDLPQHAALLGAWMRMADATSMEAAEFTINWRTPYVTAYALSRALVTFLPVLMTAKLVVWLSCVGFALAFALLVRELRYPRWLVVLGVPLSLGYSFYFGFFSFIAAIPFALLSLWAGLRYAADATPRRGVLVAGFLCATLVTHGFAAGMALMITVPVMMAGRMSLLARIVPALAPIVLGAVWLFPGPSVGGIGLTVWEPRLNALVDLPAFLLATSTTDQVAVVFGTGILLLVCLTLGRPAGFWRCAPLAALLLATCLFPVMQSGFAPTYPRFAAFMVPAMLVAFEPRARPIRLPAPAFAVALVTGWFCVFAWRLRAFEQETEPLARVVERLPGSLDVRPIVFERDSVAFPGLPALLHLPAYYAVEKGGRQGYSFAMYATSVVRYTPLATPGMLGGAEWRPESFSIEDELPLYDTFLVHSRFDRAFQLFGERLSDMTVLSSAGNWRAYGVRGRALSRANPGSASAQPPFDEEAPPSPAAPALGSPPAPPSAPRSPEAPAAIPLQEPVYSQPPTRSQPPNSSRPKERPISAASAIASQKVPDNDTLPAPASSASTGSVLAVFVSELDQSTM